MCDALTGVDEISASGIAMAMPKSRLTALGNRRISIHLHPLNNRGLLLRSSITAHCCMLSARTGATTALRRRAGRTDLQRMALLPGLHLFPRRRASLAYLVPETGDNNNLDLENMSTGELTEPRGCPALARRLRWWRWTTFQRGHVSFSYVSLHHRRQNEPADGSHGDLEEQGHQLARHGDHRVVTSRQVPAVPARLGARPFREASEHEVVGADVCARQRCRSGAIEA